MKESVTYQAILEEGEEKGRRLALKKMLRLQGESCFGAPHAREAAALKRINDLQRLEELVLRVVKVSSWQELLDLPAPRRRPPAS